MPFPIRPLARPHSRPSARPIGDRPGALRRTALAALAATASLACAAPALAEVNLYTYRQPFLMEPIIDAFTEETGIEVNTVFAKEGLVERLVAEGDNSPGDLLIVVDVGNLVAAVEAGVVQPVQSDVLEANIPAEDRDPDGQWFGLTNRARIIVTSKDRVEEGLVTSYADLAKPELEGRVCTRSGKHNYMVALIASRIAHDGAEATREWLEGVKDNLARKPQGNDRAQVKAIAEGECDVAVINSYYIGAMASDPEQQAWADAVNIVFPSQDAEGTHMNISGVVMTKAAPNRRGRAEVHGVHGGRRGATALRRGEPRVSRQARRRALGARGELGRLRARHAAAVGDREAPHRGHEARRHRRLRRLSPIPPRERSA